MKLLQTAGQIAIHQVAATKFNAVRKGGAGKVRDNKQSIEKSGGAGKRGRYRVLGEDAADVGGKPQKLPVLELRSGKIPESDLISVAEKWLGKEYKDMGNGRYLSKDGLRQFRYGKHETRNIEKQHAHFETYDKPRGSGGRLIEKTVVDVTE